MKKKTTTCNKVMHRFYSLLMTLLLVWLTVSTPYVYEAQQQDAVAQGIVDEDADNPLAGTTEEKAEGGISTLSEYLHEAHHYLPTSQIIVSVYKGHPDELYAVFHPELLSPPPEAAL